MSAQSTVRKTLFELFSKNKAGHGYIIVGEKKRLENLLYDCALVAMCDKLGCEKCDVCKKVLSRKHQDVILLPQDRTKNKLSVADIGYLVDESYKRPVDSGKSRVFLLDASDSVSGVAAEAWQNKLLKTLEEPLAGVYIFIGVTDAEALLPTVRSRCQVIKEDTLCEQTIASKLAETGFDSKSCQIAAVLCGGSLAAAERIVVNRQVYSAAEVALDTAKNLASTKNALKFASAMLSVKENLADCLNFYVRLLAESIYYRLAPSLCVLPALKADVQRICANYSLQAAEVCIELICKAKKDLDDGSNAVQTVDRLLASILEVKYRCRL